MRGLFTICFIVFLGKAMSQEIATDDIDKFNGNRIVSCKIQKLIGVKGNYKILATAIGIKSNNSTAISYAFYFYPKNVIAIEKKHNSCLKLKSGEVLLLPNTGDYKIYAPDKLAVHVGLIDDASIIKLLKSNIDAIKIENSSESVQIQIDKKDSEILKSQLVAVHRRLRNK